jgi:hypothetical protein
MSMKPRLDDKPHPIPGTVNETHEVTEVGGTVMSNTVTQPKVEEDCPIPGVVSQGHYKE